MEKVTILGRYILEKVIGEGSYSVVYQGLDKDERRIVAVKEMKSAGLTKEEADEAHELFFREINIMKDLHHENIPKVYDFFLFEEKNYMVMQWIDGEDLLSLHKKNGLMPEAQALRYMAQIAEALVYLQHEGRSIIYKDLKPSNIIVDEDGRIKIIDFGISRRYDPKKEKDTHILGTPGYAPPEVYTETQTDFSADVYSLGAAFYHLTTGQEPLRFRFNFPDPRDFNPELTEEFAELLTDCLKKRGERIKNAGELRGRIGEVGGKKGEEHGEKSISNHEAIALNPSSITGIMALVLILLMIGSSIQGVVATICITLMIVIILLYPVIILLMIIRFRCDLMNLALLITLFLAFLFLLWSRAEYRIGPARLQ